MLGAYSRVAAAAGDLFETPGWFGPRTRDVATWPADPELAAAITATPLAGLVAGWADAGPSPTQILAAEFASRQADDLVGTARPAPEAAAGSGEKRHAQCPRR